MENNKFKEAYLKLKEADAIIVGVGSGMSSSCGYNYYNYNEVFDKYFGKYGKEFGFDSIMKGFYHVFNDNETKWAFYSELIDFIYTAETGKCYKDLNKLLNILNKPYHILSTNVDHQLSRVIDEQKICYFNGDFRYFQCIQPCHDEVYFNKDVVKSMKKSIKNFRIEKSLVPRCPHCYFQMTPWVNDDTFLRGKKFNDDYNRYLDFVRSNIDKKIVLLELGVGDMTPSIIKLPFWQMTYEYKDCFLINVTLDKTTPPLHLENKNYNFICDITKFIEKLLEIGENDD